MAELDEVVREFLVESYELIDQVDQDLLILEKDPASYSATCDSLMRSVHTIKGTCGFFGFNILQGVTHVGEELLTLLRDGKVPVSTARMNVLFDLVDAVRQLLQSLETTGSEGDLSFDPLIEELTRLKDPSSDSDGGSGANLALEEQQESKNEFQASGASASDSTNRVADSTIRVDVGLLDSLMNLVGELVLTRNQIIDIASRYDDNAILSTTQQLNLITSELQESVMKTRMQPIDTVWNKFLRVVRDLARTCGKQIRIEMEGQETELDKTLLEAIKDPLTHIIRNAVDHGIEGPQEREAAGKVAEGTLSLRASHESGHVIIEIADDGGGIDVSRVREKAISKGLFAQSEAEKFSDREVVNLIFHPGFSTAEQVTNISGRGVGMDVVKRNIEKIGGSVDIQSTRHQGTTFRVRIPLTLAIIPALMVRSGERQYAIPQLQLIELVRLEPEQARQKIEYFKNVPVYRLRGRLLPLVKLNDVLGLKPVDRCLGLDEKVVNIVVLQSEHREFGLVVESINDSKEIVVKPLVSQLKHIACFAGATVMGDGSIALILDVSGIAAGLQLETQNACGTAMNDASNSQQECAHAAEQFLIVDSGSSKRVAVPLSDVSRLEEFEQHIVEQTYGREVVQYRGQILPLLHLSEVLGESNSKIEANGEGGDDSYHVIVYGKDSPQFGLAVRKILDIVSEDTAIRWEGAERKHFLGTAVLQGQVTELIDLQSVGTSVGSMQ